MSWTLLDTWIVVTGALGAMSCALLGSFLLLRRLSMMGDAISHAVLPGLAVAFLLTESRGSWPMFVGAALTGILTAAFTQWLHSHGKVDEGASMGIVFTFLFAVGLILIVRGADAVDLDPGCVLYGAIELTPLDTVAAAGWNVPRAALTTGLTLLINAAFVTLFFKELRISAFDPELATTLGFHSTILHYLLITLVAVTTVACFESIGSILVIAMLIVPAATAFLLTDRLAKMVGLAVVIAAAAAALGHVGAITLPPRFGFADTSTAGMMAVAAGGLFFAAMIAAPRNGILARAVHRAALSLRIAREDVLGLLYRIEELPPPPLPTDPATVLESAVGTNRLTTRMALRMLRHYGLVSFRDHNYVLTARGRETARGLVRSHRLWESYAAKHFGLPADHLHLPASRVEHYISGQLREEIARDVEDARRDPHGHPIPGADVENGPIPPPDSRGR